MSQEPEIGCAIGSHPNLRTRLQSGKQIMKAHWTTAVILCAVLGFTARARGQAATPAGPTATPAPAAAAPAATHVLPLPDFHFRGSVGRTIAESDPPEFPQPVRPPQGADEGRLRRRQDVRHRVESGKLVVSRQELR